MVRDGAGSLVYLWKLLEMISFRNTVLFRSLAGSLFSASLDGSNPHQIWRIHSKHEQQMRRPDKVCSKPNHFFFCFCLLFDFSLF